MLALTLSTLLTAVPPLIAQSQVTEGMQVAGGVQAPAALPAGTIAFYGLVGAPELAAGFRQGFSTFELEARASFNYFQVSSVWELGVKVPVLRRDRWNLAPGLAVGAVFDGGERYVDSHNFSYSGVRLRPNATAVYALGDAIQLVGMVEVPCAFALNVSGSEVTPTLGLGAELYLGGPFSVLAFGQAGVDVMHEPLGSPQVRPAFTLRLGVGYRLF